MDCAGNPHPVRGLSDDLLTEILSRLPVKSLLQCKSVSKAWHALISDGQRRRRLPSAICGLFYHAHVWGPGWSYVVDYVAVQSHIDGDRAGVDLSFLPRRSCRILDCTNGLLLCHSFESNSSVYYVCNPATERWAELPQPGYTFRPLALDFDPRVSRHYAVLGFKVKRRFNEETPITFSSQTRGWLEKQLPWRCGFAPYVSRHVFLNGSIHFLAYGEPVALAMDFQREVYRKIALPGSRQGPDYLNGCFGQSQGCLHYAQVLEDQVMVWVLNDYDGNEWTLKHGIGLQALLEKQEVWAVAPTSSPLFQMLIFHPELDVLFVKIHVSLFAYHLGSAKLTEVLIPQRDTRSFHAYAPCLLEDMDL